MKIYNKMMYIKCYSEPDRSTLNQEVTQTVWIITCQWITKHHGTPWSTDLDNKGKLNKTSLNAVSYSHIFNKKGADPEILIMLDPTFAIMKQKGSLRALSLVCLETIRPKCITKSWAITKGMQVTIIFIIDSSIMKMRKVGKCPFQIP